MEINIYYCVFSNSIYFKSYADITANSDSPMFVDDVLETIFSFLSSW